MGDETRPGHSAALNVPATVLIAAVTAAGGLLAVLGANQDRVWGILDGDDDVGKALWAAAALAILAVGCSLVSYFTSSSGAQRAFLGTGVAGYLGGLSCVLLAVAGAADVPGYPTFGRVSVTTTGQPPGAVVFAFTVRAEGLDEGQRVAVKLVSPSGVDTFTASLPTTPGGIVEQAVEVLAARQAGTWLLQAWWSGRELRCPPLQQPLTDDPPTSHSACVTVALS